MNIEIHRLLAARTEGLVRLNAKTCRVAKAIALLSLCRCTEQEHKAKGNDPVYQHYFALLPKRIS